MDITTIEAVVKKVANSSLHQVTISEGAQSITVVNRRPSQLSSTTSCDITDNSALQSAQQVNEPTKPTAKQIISSYVGYVQLGQDAAAAPLVQPGDLVQVGQTVAYVDVLSKLMPVFSEYSGVIQQILVNNGDKVDYAKPIIELQ